MSTKYELATELRTLTRGMKPLPISKMKKHELESEIDRIKALKDMKDAMAEYPKAKPGPIGPREIPVATTSIGEVTIAVPHTPAKRTVGPVSIRHKEKVVFNDVPISLPAAPLPEDKPKHRCNCPYCPDKA